MRAKLGLVSMTAWLFFVWISIAVWAGDLLRLTRRRYSWIYMAGHGVALFFVHRWLEQKLARKNRLTTGSFVSLSRRRVLVLATIVIIWITGYFVLLFFFPSLLTKAKFAIPIVLLCVPVLVAVTVLEGMWANDSKRG